ncbi:MAG: hypothetical protein H7A23_24710 [Leptospiraceae bacterium]|nr:hypothetical protein [Leptospiraceae bacterium]MCP5497768.1 hypothetical protein [Leptospiraceae bacterium]
MNRLIQFYILLLIFSVQVIFSQENLKKDNVELILPEDKIIQGTWGQEADEIKLFSEIKILDELSEENTKKWLEKSRDNFNTAITEFKDTAQKINKKKEKMFAEVDALDIYQWRKDARKENIERKLNTELIKARKKSIVNLIKGMQSIDKIENPEVLQTPIYTDLKASLYREYIKHQFNLKNYYQASEMIEEYFKVGRKEGDIYGEFEKEAMPHKLLAICYESVEKVAKKYNKKALYMEYNELKNKHIIRYAELAYGKDSNQYNRVIKKLGMKLN